MRGRPPVPTAIKLLNGNPGKRPLNDDEPKLEVKIPECPDHLNELARREWDRLAPILVLMGVLTEADYQALSMLCQSYATVIEASEKLEKSGFLIHHKKSGTFQANPLFGIIDRANKMCKELQSKFGLNPSDRSRIHVNTKSKTDGNRWAKVG